MSASVSIAVLNYQRRDRLRRVLESARWQRHPVEILVVDNASTDGSGQMVRDEFPDVRLIELPENVATAARNIGVAAAKGDIVFTIDNDVLFTTPDDVARTLEVFARYPNAAIVNFAMLGADGGLSRRDWCHPRDIDVWGQREFLTDYVLEGSSACRREAFLGVGGYWAPLFIGHEGWDLALRLLNAGHDLVYAPAIRVRHLVDPGARPSTRIYYTFTRNAVWVALRNLRPRAALVWMAQDLALMAYASARAGQLHTYRRALVDAVRGRREALATREPMSRQAAARLAQIRALKPSVLARVARHVRERLI